MIRFERVEPGLCLLLFVAVMPLAVLAWLEPLAFVFAAPWLVALLWAVRRSGPPRADAFPSAAEDARRRLAIR